MLNNGNVFAGCYFHGHDCRLNTMKDLQEMARRRAATASIDAKLIKVGQNSNSIYGPFDYHSIYECEFWDNVWSNNSVANSLKLLKYYQNYPLNSLKPRDALRGGRTNSIKHAVGPLTDGSQIHYYDFTRQVYSFFIFRIYFNC